MNISELYESAKSAPSEDLLTSEELPNGQPVQAKVVWAKSGKTKAGAFKLNIKFEVTSGEHAGRAFFDGLNFSAGEKDTQKQYNKRLFAKLAVLGVDDSFIRTNPSEESIAKAIVGAEITHTPVWDDVNEQGQQYMSNNSKWVPASVGSVPSDGVIIKGI